MFNRIRLYCKKFLFPLNHAGESKHSKIGLVLGIIGGVIGLLIIGVIFIICKGKKKGCRPEVFVDVPGEFSVNK